MKGVETDEVSTEKKKQSTSKEQVIKDKQLIGNYQMICELNLWSQINNRRKQMLGQMKKNRKRMDGERRKWYSDNPIITYDVWQ